MNLINFHYQSQNHCYTVFNLHLSQIPLLIHRKKHDLDRIIRFLKIYAQSRDESQTSPNQRIELDYLQIFLVICSDFTPQFENFQTASRVISIVGSFQAEKKMFPFQAKTKHQSWFLTSLHPLKHKVQVISLKVSNHRFPHLHCLPLFLVLKWLLLHGHFMSLLGHPG